MNPPPVTLRRLLESSRLADRASTRPELVGADVAVAAITIDSRRVTSGTLFCCIRGGSRDGHAFAADAVAAGAVALLVDHRLALDIAQLVVADVRAAVGPLAAALHGHPSESLVVVGITGTNGKTTTAHLLAAILERAGLPTTIFGTLSGTFTTPEAPELQERFAQALAAGKRAVVMEVSSHALALHRVGGTHFTVGVFTNLGRDHLDFHGTEEQYFAAKARLVTAELTERCVLNVGDVHGRLLRDAVTIPAMGFSLDDVVELSADAASHSYVWRGRRIEVPLGGRFNAENSLAAASAALSLGIDEDTIAAGLATVGSVSGRFERVDAGQPFSVVVDFAHTPDGLAQLLAAARQATTGRVIVVFGCGGDRDATKRPLMGQVAAQLADAVIVTSDNPRTEDPRSIIGSVLDGVPAEYRRRVTSDPDRRSAIQLALEQAAAGDTVLVAGKGHETTQTIGTTALPFDDRAVVRELLENPS